MNGIENSALAIPPGASVETPRLIPELGDKTSLASLNGSLAASPADPATSPTSSDSPELFHAAEMLSLSPRLRWLKEQGISIVFHPARAARYRIGRFSAATENEVIYKYAKRKRVTLPWELVQSDDPEF